jgi:hypothetical protein
MRQGGVVRFAFLHSDYLGSTSLTTDEAGAPIAGVRYLPYGEERWSEGGAASDYTFTGQRAERGFGLMDYRAGYYTLRRPIHPARQHRGRPVGPGGVEQVRLRP